jgi:hypothetical protein
LSALIDPDPAGHKPTASAFDRPSPDRPNAQNGGTPSAPGAVGAHPFQTTALRKRYAIITKNLTVDVRSSV